MDQKVKRVCPERSDPRGWQENQGFLGSLVFLESESRGHQVRLVKDLGPRETKGILGYLGKMESQEIRGQEDQGELRAKREIPVARAPLSQEVRAPR